jgi:hypothetical protein
MPLLDAAGIALVRPYLVAHEKRRPRNRRLVLVVTAGFAFSGVNLSTPLGAKVAA